MIESMAQISSEWGKPIAAMRDSPARWYLSPAPDHGLRNDLMWYSELQYWRT